jgi:hypothetical protein
MVPHLTGLNLHKSGRIAIEIKHNSDINAILAHYPEAGTIDQAQLAAVGGK